LSFGAGALAGAAATVASYPFDLLRTTLAAQGEPKVYRGTLDAARGVLARSGPRGLYAGLGTTLVEIVPYAALQFGLYDGLTKAADRRAAERGGRNKARRNGYSSSKNRDDESEQVVTTTADAATRFLCGLAAGTAAKLATHPLDVAKKRYQVAGLARSAAYGARVPATAAARPLFATLSAVAAKEGVAGLYKGALPSILKAAPQAAVTLAAYEFFAGWIASGGCLWEEKRWRRRRKEEEEKKKKKRRETTLFCWRYFVFKKTVVSLSLFLI
jgi:solute carrier family 25 (mitochondrial thiamine pyrophosphate transporter), member 19